MKALKYLTDEMKLPAFEGIATGRMHLFLRACFKTIKAPVLKATVAGSPTIQNPAEEGEFSRKRPFSSPLKTARRAVQGTLGIIFGLNEERIKGIYFS